MSDSQRYPGNHNLIDNQEDNHFWLDRFLILIVSPLVLTHQKLRKTTNRKYSFQKQKMDIKLDETTMRIEHDTLDGHTELSLHFRE